MKLHFEANLDYQLAAIEAVCTLFHGQEVCRTEFTVTRDVAIGQQALPGMENVFVGVQRTLPGIDSDLGIGNRLQLLDDDLLANLNNIQLYNGLRLRDHRLVKGR